MPWVTLLLSPRFGTTKRKEHATDPFGNHACLRMSKFSFSKLRNRETAWCWAGIGPLLFLGLVNLPKAKVPRQVPPDRLQVSPLANKGLPPSALLAAWRTSDPLGRSCSKCHAPDGLDLADFDFNKQDILRRALRHLSPTEAEKAVDLVEWRRQGLPVRFQNTIGEPLMQPGGKILPGNSPIQKDDEFVKRLSQQIPQLFHEVVSLQQANDLLKALRQSNPMHLRVGIKMSRLSEDGFFGSQHALVNEWLPENSLPNDPAFSTLQDAYLAHPNWKTLQTMLEAVVKMKGMKSEADALSREKFLALTIFQHALRMKEGLIPSKPMPISLFEALGQNPFWEVGNTCRLSQFLQLRSYGLAPDVLAEKERGPSFKKQMKAMELAWLWLGFCFDPSLEHSGPRKDVPRAKYLVDALLDGDKYPSHMLYLLAKKTAAQFEEAKEHPSTALGTGFQFEFDPLIYSDKIQEIAPSAEPAKSLFIQGVRALFEASLYWQIEAIQQSGKVVYPAEELSQIRIMASFLAKTGSPRLKLVQQVRQAVSQ